MRTEVTRALEQSANTSMENTDCHSGVTEIKSSPVETDPNIGYMTVSQKICPGCHVIGSGMDIVQSSLTCFYI
uniref:Uncharacterized protein n=1 Tax=Anguilla anguilla TaxID=7936 RepID=A0A0E9TJF5_ANGAN